MREDPFQHLRSMPAQAPSDSGISEEAPLQQESSVLILDVLDRIPSGYELQGLSQPSMYLVRARIDDESIDSPGKDVDTSSILAQTQDTSKAGIVPEVRNLREFYQEHPKLILMIPVEVVLLQRFQNRMGLALAYFSNVGRGPPSSMV
jgi:hypothetical protein